MTLRALTVLLALFLLVAHAAAQPDGDGAGDAQLEELQALLDDPVVTTASRGAERASTAPATMFTISAEEMHAFGIRSVDEALAWLGVGLHVQKARDYATGLDVGAQGIMLRDYGRHLLVLLDGHVMNSQSSGEVPLHEGLGVPLEAIDHIEVMLGAGSVMYGSNAMTAVVQIVTRSAEAMRGEHVVGELSLSPPSGLSGRPRAPHDAGELGYRYRVGAGSAHPFRLAGVPASISVHAEWLHELSQTYEARAQTDSWFEVRPGEITWGGPTSHRMHSPSGLLALTVQRFSLRLSGGAYERTMPLSGGIYGDPYARERRVALRLDLSHEQLLSERLSLRSRFYLDHMSAAERSSYVNPWWCVPEQERGCHFQRENTGRWAGLEQQLVWDARLDGKLVTTVGYDARYRHALGRPSSMRDLETNQPPTDIALPRIHRKSFLGALFVQQLWQPHALVTVNLGARLDLDSLIGAHLSPRVAVVLTPSERTALRASYAEAFRGPSVFELDEADVTYRIAPRSLAPEVVRTVELEWQQRVSLLTYSLRAFGAFYRDLVNQRAATDDEVTRALAEGRLVASVDRDGIVISDNLDTLDAYGGSLTLQLKATEALTIAGSSTLSFIAVEGERPPLWPRLFGNLRVSYRFGASGATLALAALYAHGRKAYNDIEPALVTYPSMRDQLDLRLTFAAPVRSLRGLTVRVGAGALVNPDQPYLIAAPLVTDPSIRLEYQHSQPQLHLLLGARYDW